MTTQKHASRLEQIITSEVHSHQGEVSVVILCDTSGSITESDFQLMITSVRGLAMRLRLEEDNGRVEVAVAQFACRSYLDCAFTSSNLDFSRAVQNMTRSAGGGTNTFIGLDLCASLFAASGRPMAKRFVIVLTDGGSNNYKRTINSAISLREEYSAAIMCIGIGSGINENEIKGISTFNYDIMIKSMESLKDAFMLMNCQPCGPPIVNCSGRSSSSLTLKFNAKGEVDKYKVEILDVSSSTDYKKAGVTRVDFLEIRNLKPDTQYFFKAKAIMTANNLHTGWSKPVAFTTLRYFPEDAILTNRTTLKKSIESLRQELEEFELPKGVENLNVLLLGLFGSGKSSMANTWLKSMEKQPIIPVAKSDTHVTTSLGMYYVDKYGLTLWDTYGWDDQGSNYSKEILSLLTNGSLYKGFKMVNPKYGIDLTDKRLNLQTDLSDRVHCIIIVVDGPSVTDSDYLNVLGEFKQQLINRKYSPLFVLNKMDEIDTDLKKPEKMTKMYNSDRVVNCMEKAALKMNVEIETLTPFVSYTAQVVQEDDVKTYLSLSLVKKALESASLYVSYMQNENNEEEETMVTRKRSSSRMAETKSESRRKSDTSATKSPPSPSSIRINVKKRGGRIGHQLSVPQTYEELIEIIKTKFKISDDIQLLNDKDNLVAEIDSLRNDDVYYVAKESELDE